jgi:CRISPR/Cas system CSM-associated protein Csm3 (group 7 of RAMP superfamily)
MPMGEKFWNPYNWVPVSNEPVSRAAPLYHHCLQGLAGRLDMTLEALTPLLINDGKGSFVASKRTGRPFIPGTSLKGMVRSLAELVGNAAVPIDRSQVDAEHRVERGASADMGQLDVCARMFGYLLRGKVFAGLVRFSDAHPEGTLPGMHSFRICGGTPDPEHRPFYPTNRARKLYHHKTNATELTAPHTGIRGDQSRTIRVLGRGARFRFAVDFENLREDEVALLLYCLVLEEQVSVTLSPQALTPDHPAPLTLTGPMRHKLGYGKPQGAGSVHLRVERLVLRTNPADRYRGRAAAGLDLTGEALREEVRRRTAAITARQDATMMHLRAMMIYAEGDPRAEKLDYPTYAWFQDDKLHPPPKPLKPVL